jgi:HlyD family secretion protein
MNNGRRALVFGSIGVVVVGGVLGGRALADSSSQVASFRTATVKRATVSQTEQRSGIIEPVAQGTVAFPIAGNVTGVAVQPGQSVTAGQALATLDTSVLQAQLTAQQAQLAAAQLTLSNGLNGISSSSNGGSSSGTAQRTTSTPTTTRPAQTSSRSSGSGGSSGGSGSSGSLGSARQAVASGQQRVDGALSTAHTALANASSSCGSSNGTFKPTGSSASSDPSSSGSSSTTSTTTPQQSGASQQCVNDLQASLNAQQQVATAQSALAQAESALDAMLANASPTGSASQQATSASAAPASTPSLSGPTSAELVADQAAVDAAQANVTAAQQNLAQGTIVSPIDGTVAAVNMKAGDHVSAASSTGNIVVVGPGGYEVTTTVPVTDIGNVKLGDAASVVPDGSGSAADGKVVSIGVTPTTSGSTTVYPVVIGLNGSPEGLRNGGAASVAITLNQVANVLAVPTSAVRTAGGGALHIVDVLSGSSTRTVPVQVGATGPDLTEIKSGLQEGQQVVIADLNAPLPSNTTNRIGGGGGGGGLGGGGGAFGGATIGRGG